MNYIKSLTIEGLKKFEHFNIEFDKNINIIIGENEAGKSTILEAINICLNQLYRNTDKSIIKDLLNINNVKNFEKNPSIENLPRIQIEIEFNLDNYSKNNFLFYGMHNQDKNEKYGIKYSNAVPVFRLLIPTLFFGFPAIIFGWPTLGAIGKAKETTITTIIAISVYIIYIVGLIVTKSFTITNIAIGRSITEMVLFGTRYWFYRKYKSKYFDKWFSRKQKKCWNKN